MVYSRQMYQFPAQSLSSLQVTTQLIRSLGLLNALAPCQESWTAINNVSTVEAM